MSILNLNGPSGRAPRSNGAVKVWMGIGLVIAVLGVGSTLASTITINGGTKTEFGQGVQRTVYCGGNKEITVTPVSRYVNIPEPIPSSSSDSDSPNNSTPPVDLTGSFYLKGIKVSKIPSDCSGVDFVLTAYNQFGEDLPMLLATNSGDEIRTPTVYWLDTPSSRDKPAVYGGLLSVSREEDQNYRSGFPAQRLKVNLKNGDFGSFEIMFADATANALTNDVGRIVIETQNDTFGADEIESGRQLITPSTVYED